MNAKLTLKLKKDVIERAKRYAQKNNLSLSSLVQNYFSLISEKYDVSDEEISPLVQEMSGIIKLEKNFDLKKEYLDERILFVG